MRVPCYIYLGCLASIGCLDSSSVSQEVLDARRSCSEGLFQQAIVGHVVSIQCDPTISRRGCTLGIALDSTRYSAIRSTTCADYSYDRVHNQLNLLMPHIWMGTEGHGRIRRGFVIRKKAGNYTFEVIDLNGNIIRSGNPWGLELPVEEESPASADL